MDSEIISWKTCENTVAKRLVDGSSIYMFDKCKKIKQRTKLFNDDYKKIFSSQIKNYKQYVKIKTAILRTISDNEQTEIDENSDVDLLLEAHQYDKCNYSPSVNNKPTKSTPKKRKVRSDKGVTKDHICSACNKKVSRVVPRQYKTREDVRRKLNLEISADDEEEEEEKDHEDEEQEVDNPSVINVIPAPCPSEADTSITIEPCPRESNKADCSINDKSINDRTEADLSINNDTSLEDRETDDSISNKIILSDDPQTDVSSLNNDTETGINNSTLITEAVAESPTHNSSKSHEATVSPQHSPVHNEINLSKEITALSEYNINDNSESASTINESITCNPGDSGIDEVTQDILLSDNGKNAEIITESENDKIEIAESENNNLETQAENFMEVNDEITDDVNDEISEPMPQEILETPPPAIKEKRPLVIKSTEILTSKYTIIKQVERDCNVCPAIPPIDPDLLPVPLNVATETDSLNWVLNNIEAKHNYTNNFFEFAEDMDEVEVTKKIWWGRLSNDQHCSRPTTV